MSLTYGFKSHLPHQTLKNGSITKVEPFLFLILKIKYGIFLKQLQRQQNFQETEKKDRIAELFGNIEELDKQTTDKQSTG
ncbi:MAG: hypothetical protein ACLR13_02800 [Acutalibacteraceae bacterium]